MVFSTCCLVLSGGALATDYEFAPVANEVIAPVANEEIAPVANEVIAPFALREDGVSLMSVAGSPSVTSNKPVSYGVSGSNYASWSSGILKVQSDHFDLSSHTFQNAGGSTYMLVDKGTYIDLTYNISGAYPRDKSIEIWGSFNGRLACYSKVGTLATKPKKCSILVDGISVADYVDASSFKYTHTMDAGDSVTSITVRYYYPDYFDLGANDPAIDNGVRYLLLYPGTFNTNINMTQQGFFDSLFSWLGNIRDGISNVVSSISSGFSNLLNAVTSLPSKIADAIKGLFVPSDSQMDELKASFNSLLSEKLGFVYQAGSLVDGVFDAVFDAVDNPDSDVSFTVPAFPSFSVAGTEVSLWEDPVVVDIADNEVVQTVQQVASPFVVAVMIWGFVHSMEEAFLAFIGGKSLAEWVRNRKEDAD